jgi:hypothetical protein
MRSEGSFRQITGPTNRNRIEAAALGKESKISKAQYPYGKRGRICGGYKCESGCALPGEICRYVISESVDNRRREASLNWQKSADDIVGGFDPTEGRNMEQRMRSL